MTRLNTNLHPFACPDCGSLLSGVRDSRERGSAIHRRRECENGHRYSTIERSLGDFTMDASVMTDFKTKLEVAMKCLAQLSYLTDMYGGADGD